MTAPGIEPSVSLTRLHAALLTVGNGLVEGSAADLLAAEAELSSLVRDLPSLVEAVRHSRHPGAFAHLVDETQAALRRAQRLGRHVESTARELAEAQGHLLAYGPAGENRAVASMAALDARG